MFLVIALISNARVIGALKNHFLFCGSSGRQDAFCWDALRRRTGRRDDSGSRSFTKPGPSSAHDPVSLRSTTASRRQRAAMARTAYRSNPVHQQASSLTGTRWSAGSSPRRAGRTDARLLYTENKNATDRRCRWNKIANTIYNRETLLYSCDDLDRRPICGTSSFQRSRFCYKVGVSGLYDKHMQCQRYVCLRLLVWCSFVRQIGSYDMQLLVLVADSVSNCFDCAVALL